MYIKKIIQYKNLKIYIIILYPLVYTLFRHYISFLGIVMTQQSKELLFINSMTFFSFSYAIFQLLAGYLLDKFKEKLIIFCTICTSICFCLLSYVSIDYFPYIFFLMGIYFSVAALSFSFFLSQIISTQIYGRVSAIIKFIFIQTITIILFFVSPKTFKAIRMFQIILSFICLFIGILIFFFLFVNSKTHHNKLKDNSITSLDNNESQHSSKQALLNNVQQVNNKKEILYHAVLGAIIVVPFYCFRNGWFYNLPGNSQTAISITNLCLSVSIVVFPFIYEKYNIKIYNLLFFPSVIQCIGIFLNIFIQYKWLTYCTAIYIGINHGTHLLLYLYIIKKKPKNMGLLLGVTNFIVMIIGSTILPYILSVIKLTFGLSKSLILLFVINIILLLLCKGKKILIN